MAAMDVTQTDEPRCPSCAHAEGCACTCCPADPEAEFAEFLDRIGCAYLREGDIEACGWFWDAADWHQEPPESRRTTRMLLLSAAVARNGKD